jgi:hypothetical protein
MRLALRLVAELALMAAVALAALASAGCMLGDGYSARDRVTNAARDYNDGVRWGRYDRAVQHVTPERRQRFIERHKGLEDELEFDDCEVVDLDVDTKNKTRATAHVEYVWTLKREGLLRKTATEQVWVEKGGRWVVDSETRTKGSPLSLFDEPTTAH